MSVRQQPERDPEPPSTAALEGLPKIETPVIKIQDLEHKADPDTRVNNSGVKIQPSGTERLSPELEDEKKDEIAREAMTEFDRYTKDLPPV
jgi:hypothetical protein